MPRTLVNCVIAVKFFAGSKLMFFTRNCRITCVAELDGKDCASAMQGYRQALAKSNAMLNGIFKESPSWVAARQANEGIPRSLAFPMPHDIDVLAAAMLRCAATAQSKQRKYQS